MKWQLKVFLICISQKAMAPHSSTLAWKIPWVEEPGRLQSMGSLRVRHDWATSLSLFTFTFHFHTLEKEMETHSSVLAWRIPEMGEPGGAMGSHRVRHDWSNLAAAAAAAMTNGTSQVALMIKNLPANAGDLRDAGLIPGSRRSPGEGNGNLLQYSRLGNPMDSGSWRVTVHGVAKSWRWLSKTYTHN